MSLIQDGVIWRRASLKLQGLFLLFFLSKSAAAPFVGPECGKVNLPLQNACVGEAGAAASHHPQQCMPLPSVSPQLHQQTRSSLPFQLSFLPILGHPGVSYYLEVKDRRLLS